MQVTKYESSLLKFFLYYRMGNRNIFLIQELIVCLFQGI